MKNEKTPKFSQGLFKRDWDFKSLSLKKESRVGFSGCCYLVFIGIG
jgi:hypothetical protein